MLCPLQVELAEPEVEASKLGTNSADWQSNSASQSAQPEKSRSDQEQPLHHAATQREDNIQMSQHKVQPNLGQSGPMSTFQQIPATSLSDPSLQGCPSAEGKPAAPSARHHSTPGPESISVGVWQDAFNCVDPSLFTAQSSGQGRVSCPHFSLPFLDPSFRL